MIQPHRAGATLLLPTLFAAALAGCDGQQESFGKWPWAKPPRERVDVAVPEPIDLLLPRTIRVHPFTGTRTFDQSGGVRGIDVRVEALDAYDDSTRAFGKFRFALHQHRRGGEHPRGDRIATWEEDLMDGEVNQLHWDNITRTYKFKLRWDHPIPVGRKFVLVVTFDSPFTERRFAEQTFISGQ